MAIISALLSVLGSSAVGSVIGGLFAFLNRKTDLEAKRIELTHEASKWAHELNIRDKDISLAQAEAQGKKDVAVIEADGAFEKARMDAIGRAQENDKTDKDEIIAAGRLGWMYVLVAVLNKAIRPVSTIIIVGAVLSITSVLLTALTNDWTALDKADKLALAKEACQWLFGQASIIISYWYVSRGSSGNGQIK